MREAAAGIGVVHLADLVRLEEGRAVWGRIPGLDPFRRKEIEAKPVPQRGVCLQLGQVWWSQSWQPPLGEPVCPPHMVVRIDRRSQVVYGVPVTILGPLNVAGGVAEISLQPGSTQRQTRWEWGDFLPGASARRYITGAPRLSLGLFTYPVGAVWDVPSPQWMESEDRPG